MWPLTKAWYGDRVADDYAPASIDHLQRLLDSAGLTSPFWRLTEDGSAV
ncbi:MAG: hypothetical protein AAF945_20735 [Actinomycetota bacterium]